MKFILLWMFFFSTALFTIEAATTCADRQCFCGQKDIPPSCYQEPNPCCSGKAPEPKKDPISLEDIIKKVREKSTTEQKKLTDQALVSEIAIEYANTCSQRGCFCGQGSIPASCYQDPNRCCNGEAPKDKTDSEEASKKLSDKLKGCDRYDGAISCPDGTYVKKSDDPNNMFQLIHTIDDTNRENKKPQERALPTTGGHSNSSK